MSRGQIFSLFFIFSTTADISSKLCQLRSNGEVKDHYLPGFVESTVDNVGYQQCIQICYRKVNCESINYDKHKLKCEINSAIMPGQTLEDILEFRQGSTHNVVNKTAMNEDERSCGLLNCPLNTQCLKLQDKTAICHPEPCRRADYLLSSKLNFCFKIHDQQVTSTIAIQKCNAENATLAFINSAEKKDYYDKEHLRFKFSTRLGFFIAGSYLGGVWKLPDNTVLDQSVEWSKVYMNQDGPCMVLWRSSDRYMLTDGSCTAKYRFICEQN